MSRPTKKRKIQDSNAERTNNIQEIENSLQAAVSQGSSLNRLSDLLEIAEKNGEDPKVLHKALYALYRTFSLLISKNWFHSPQAPSEKAQIVRQWLFKRLDQYLGILFALLDHSEPLILDAAWQIPLSLLKQLSSSLSAATGRPQIHYRIFRQIVPAYITSDTALVRLKKLTNEYDDIRWFILREIPSLLSAHSSVPDNNVTEHVLELLENIDSMPSQKDDINEFYITELSKPPAGVKFNQKAQENSEDSDDDDDWSKFFDTQPAEETASAPERDGRASEFSTHKALFYVQSHRAQFSAAWLALMQHIKTSPERSNRVLSILHRSIMPHLTQPLQLVDWIGACVDFDGATALLAFNALFVLIQKHNLDYPDFYTRLYALLDANILHVRYRARFFRLLEVFLSSTHLPATLLASFLKRLARLSLSAPPPAIIMIIPFTYNILKRHPSLMPMIHRDFDPTIETDPFLAEEPSPLRTNAISSSLWELNSHRSHYAAPVSTLTQIFSEAFTKPSYMQEDFLDHTYGTLYTSETKRKITKEPALNIVASSNLFGPPEELSVSTDPCGLWA
ncbi:Uncharacterized protein C1604.06c [Serendipita indica DSM 11827]|uniref:Related to NOC4-ribosome biogenesis protein n=1 Tax=Serendipita indica (strain DSM 11827) TaxID=1109443 RepID=G4T7M4_SERID|nr:Uncharacterized protein C1604.06c [Serendipita indica DSM 11827]CCA67332.1 related to NOC4-ribosome biogenesis protein [Serendipita indica DSM 11827]